MVLWGRSRCWGMVVWRRWGGVGVGCMYRVALALGSELSWRSRISRCWSRCWCWSWASDYQSAVGVGLVWRRRSGGWSGAAYQSVWVVWERGWCWSWRRKYQSAVGVGVGWWCWCGVGVGRGVGVGVSVGVEGRCGGWGWWSVLGWRSFNGKIKCPWHRYAVTCLGQGIMSRLTESSRRRRGRCIGEGTCQGHRSWSWGGQCLRRIRHSVIVC